MMITGMYLGWSNDIIDSNHMLLGVNRLLSSEVKLVSAALDFDILCCSSASVPNQSIAFNYPKARCVGGKKKSRLFFFFFNYKTGSHCRQTYRL